MAASDDKAKSATVAAATGAGGKEQNGTKGLILAILILTVLGVATGGGLGVQLATTVEKVVAAKAKEEPVKKEQQLFYAGNTMMQPMKPVIVNLASPPNTWVRIESSFVFKNGALANPALTESTLREDMMSYLRTLTLSQFEGPSALQQLREDLNERARVRSEGRVDELIIETLVVQ
ncbi:MULTISPECIES: flagellar basal body-associated protein FliL [Azorhizobium]|jgi:flagellar FliL protein|uniref:Flagellar protein FliL n=1 Tax=Azorhizobium caulinodans (strain ATCC 43989 / DSM 5975 / JCM 20966 / LMG 6465 / NBRC 14845 / NCIMB 13405 / ORS 571) TaxID=438753 RepID=A8IPJ2_AZOC5|nr:MULTISPECIES: flagellar basal body-associated FliL family protein [Azorhizobium]TDT88899.1 flagellar FliL protein [Azorhizobium sp. AG788]BAF86627.1 flagellar basal body-associated protein [Azorhizobium caulinodans ORS 571]